MGRPGSCLTVTAATLAVFGFAASAQAAFPGINGRIGYALETYPTLSDAESSYELVTILSDGTARRAVGGAAYGPVAFSPDGRRIIYVDGYDLDMRIASFTTGDRPTDRPSCGSTTSGASGGSSRAPTQPGPCGETSRSPPPRRRARPAAAYE
jgi:hypothetical protein